MTAKETSLAGDIEILLEEYASLARRQYEVLQKSSYAQLVRREAAAYDTRLLRIQEISREIVRMRSEASQIYLEQAIRCPCSRRAVHILSGWRSVRKTVTVSKAKLTP